MIKDPMLAHLLEHSFAVEIDLLYKGGKNRLLPVFASMEEDAKKESARVWSGYMSQPGEDEGDPSGAAERAMDAGVAVLSSLSALKQAVINLLAVGLRHLFEQQKLEVQARAGTIHWPSLRSWKKIEELRLVANVVKHGEGHSASELRVIRPDLFEDPVLRRLGVNFGAAEVERPMAGEGLYVSETDLDAYAQRLGTCGETWPPCFDNADGLDLGGSLRNASIGSAASEAKKNELPLSGDFRQDPSANAEDSGRLYARAS